MATTRKAKAVHDTAMRAFEEAFAEGRWFSTFCHAPKGTAWRHPRQARKGAQ